MLLELTETQTRALSVALGEYLGQMEFELARTEKREARLQLRATFEILEEIRRRLQPPFEPFIFDTRL